MMTGLECFREELIKRGLNKAQASTKSVAVALDVLAQSDGKYMREYDLLNEIECLEEDERKLRTKNEMLKRSADSEIERVRKEYNLASGYISQWCESLKQCETAEGRDAMRVAQVFIQAVAVDTKYDNTAFIIGLAAILSRGNIGPISELKKINRKIPSPSLFDGYTRTIIGGAKEQDEEHELRHVIRI